MTDKFLRSIPIILRNEGGWVNDPSDPGGVTKYGISLRFLKATGDLNFDLDGDGDIDYFDIKALAIKNAEDAYYIYFWLPLKLDQLKNDELALQVFDFAINAGKRTAILALQLVSGCKQDGLIGHQTIDAANTFIDNIAERYKKERVFYYKDLALKKPAFTKYLKGWLNRVEKTKF